MDVKSLLPIAISWLQKWWQAILGLLGIIVMFWFGGALKSCSNSYLNHYDDNNTSTSVPNSPSLTDPNADADVLSYAQDWLNFWAPQVLADCYSNQINIQKCEPGHIQIPKGVSK